MSTIHPAIQRAEGLNEKPVAATAVPQEPTLGARAMIGFALQGGRAPRATADWMKELREGDLD